MLSSRTLVREASPRRLVSTGGGFAPLTGKGVLAPLSHLICGGGGGFIRRYPLNVGFGLFLIAIVVGYDGSDRCVADRIWDRRCFGMRAGVVTPYSGGCFGSKDDWFGIQRLSGDLPFDGCDGDPGVDLGLVWPEIGSYRVGTITLSSSTARFDRSGILGSVMPAEQRCSWMASATKLLGGVVGRFCFGGSKGGMAIGDTFDGDRGSVGGVGGGSLAATEMVLLGRTGALVGAGLSWGWAWCARVPRFWALVVWAWPDWFHRNVSSLFFKIGLSSHLFSRKDDGLYFFFF
ncbi:hypothetical protein RchiOBHm_Chr6g0275401 [Rosa chinensis]|uniref:Uncharacterized protein n=1 Tax=Rosa chinensis TaxID=74649 RepID=A0A2P6PRZ8_ROSCH|nr:hypothetical protein RchiOBHm_Chr6g0275401 [Rosa chinensis]